MLVLVSLDLTGQNTAIRYRKGTTQPYDRVGHEQKDGYRVVVYQGKYGIVNKDMEETVPPRYDSIDEWDESVDHGLWTVVLNNLYGVITSEGKEIIPCTFKYINKPLNFRRRYNPIWVVSSEKGSGVIDDDGQVVIPCAYFSINDGPDYYMVHQDVDYHDSWALFDGSGNRITDFKYTGGIDRLGENLWRVCSSRQDDRPGHEAIFYKKYGLVNSRGEEVVPVSYDYISRYQRGGKLVVGRGRKYGFMDAGTYQEIIPLRFDKASDFNHGRAAVAMDKKVGFIDEEGEMVIPCIYDDCFGASLPCGFYEFSLGVTVVGKGGKKGVIDKSGNELSAFTFKSIKVPQLRELEPFAFEALDMNGSPCFIGMSGSVFLDKTAAKNDSFNYVKEKVLEGDEFFYEILGSWYFSMKQYKEARKYLLMGYASKGKLEFAAAMLGYMYEYGVGCERNLLEAKEWYEKALDSHLIYASPQKSLYRLEKALSR